MKSTNVLYWTVTSLFAGFMLFSSVGDIMVAPEAVEFITNLGYPRYIIPFLGVAKALGSVAILIPGFHLLKEWAYAGLFFDLLGATYSGIAFHGFQVDQLFMVLPVGMLFLSYYLHHKRRRQTT